MNPPDLKGIAWNGIQFACPADWQIAAIGDSHLMLEGPHGPTMEVVWRRIKGRFSHKIHLKRLAAHLPKKMAGGFKNWPLPSNWKESVSGFDAWGFEWRASNEHGRGVLLYCPTCQRACLVHFFRHHLATRDQLPVKILKSFSDHAPDDRQLWSVFDIRATLPVPFTLDSYQLEAGKFELVFIHRSNRIILHRWALASIALKDKDLAEFAHEAALLDQNVAQEVTVGEFSGIEEHREAAGIDAWMRWLTKRPCYYWCRLWHVDACNRILAVAAETRRPMIPELFERICRHYETF